QRRPAAPPPLVPYTTLFRSAPLETMVTTTNQIVGEIKLSEDDILQNPTARFEVDMTSLDTGIALRNEHMAGEQWLNTGKFPKARSEEHTSELQSRENLVCRL